MRRQYSFDVQGAMITAKKLTRIRRMVNAYTYIISQTDNSDIRTIRMLNRKLSAFQHEADDLTERLRAVNHC